MSNAPPLFPLTSLLLAGLLAAPASAQLVAERITVDNAAERLFGGTDADGGIGDWYLSNGVVEAIVDEAALQDDLPAGVERPPVQSEASRSGGGLLDLALVGHDNDQFNQLFTVGGLSTGNFVVYDTVRAERTDSSASVIATGRQLGFDPIPSEQLRVETEYRVEPGDPFVTLRTTVSHLGDSGAGPGGFLDVMPWTTRAIVPFSPAPNLGFRHAGLDLGNPALGVETPPFAAGPGNVGPDDGVIDPVTGSVSGQVSYGLLGVSVSVDPDGDGEQPAVVSPVELLFGVSSIDATALGNLPFFGTVTPGGTLTYERRLYVGDRNDVASSANPIIRALATRRGFQVGTISGDADAVGDPDVAVSAIATRTGDAPNPAFFANSPITHFRSDPSGAFSGVVLPVGRYDIEFRTPERDPVVVSDVLVTANSDTEVSVPPFAALGTLEIVVRSPGPDRGAPAKATVLGVGDTPDPRFGRDVEALTFAPGQPDEELTPETWGSSLAADRFVFLPDGTAQVELRPGTYEVVATRGPEYSLARRTVTVAAGETTRARLRVRRVLDTPGALSADFHVHSARSLDSSAAPESRVLSFAAEGVELIVSTDHDFVLDYAPVIEALGLSDRIASLVGTEATTAVPNPPAFPSSAGHLNAWPIALDPLARKDGAVEDEYVAPNFLFSRLRRAGAEVIQYNHPRSGTRGLTTIGFFNNLGCNRCENDVLRSCSVDSDCAVVPGPALCTCVGYQPDRRLAAEPNDILLDDDVTGASGVANPDGFRNIDFDVMEVANGFGMENYLETRRDWFSLLSQAYGNSARGTIPFIPGTGVSDSHQNTLEAAGYFRTYVLGVGDEPAALDDSAFNEAVRGGRMLATSGPYIEFSLRDASGAEAGLGETFAPATQEVTLSIRVTAAPWIPVEEVRVVSPAFEASFDADSDPAVRTPRRESSVSRRDLLRLEHEVTVPLSSDTWFLVEAGAPLDPVPVADPVLDPIVPGYVALGFTNPIFVDHDGDGYAPGDGELPPVVLEARPRRRGRGLSAREEQEVRDHPAIDRIRIPETAVEELRERLGR